jgi:transcriptional regulator of acetoin/glycerol metabolism
VEVVDGAPVFLETVDEMPEAMQNALKENNS